MRCWRNDDVLVWEDAGVLWKHGNLSDEGVFVFRGKGWDWPKNFWRRGRSLFEYFWGRAVDDEIG
jgi:hypothetical protein